MPQKKNPDALELKMAVSLSGDRDLLDIADFPLVSRQASNPMAAQAIDIPDDGIHFNTMISDLEKRLILQSLEAAKGNKKRPLPSFT